VLQADPKNVQACETMGTLEFRGGNRDAARAWYQKAVKLDSQSYLAHYYFAVLSMGQRDPETDKEIEASLRTAIQLNPRFLPPYDLLASVLMSMDRYADASVLLHDSLKVASNRTEAANVQRRIVQLEQIEAARTRAEADEKAQVAALEAKPKHPTEPPDGPKHEALGVIRGVQCSYPAVIEFRVEGAKKTISVYSNNYYKLEFSALGFTPDGDMNPCKDIEGMKARVGYAESSDKSVDGQAIAVELRK
jgi:tetratricopeptide (TPR) repeat protein